MKLFLLHSELPLALSGCITVALIRICAHLKWRYCLLNSAFGRVGSFTMGHMIKFSTTGKGADSRGGQSSSENTTLGGR